MNTILTTTTGHVAPSPGADKIRGEFAVEQQLQVMGITAWTPRKITFVRRGKKRHPEPVTEPYLPGYVFADIPAEFFHDALQARGAFSTTLHLSAGSLAAVRAFQRRVEADNAEANRIIAANDRAAMVQFNPGDALEILAGPFAERLVRFRRMVIAGNPAVPQVEWETDMLGQMVRGTVDVLDVKPATP